jgi:hypothetical protein
MEREELWSSNALSEKKGRRKGRGRMLEKEKKEKEKKA